MSSFMTRRTLIKTSVLSAAAMALPDEGISATPSGLPSSAPVRIGKVGLLSQDAARLAEWYRSAVGLEEIPSPTPGISLGVDSSVLLEIADQPNLRLATPDQAGLYHTAFLLPSRAELARWVLRASQTRLPVDGASDHEVSEAIYLTDPEGNGVEIYADRAPSGWKWRDGQVEMSSKPIDFDQLMSTISAETPGWDRAPTGTIVGHVHLKVGDAARGGKWWQDEMGFDPVRAREGAVFLSTGGYHHHIAVNQWQSAGAGLREPGSTGLAFVELASRIHESAQIKVDPWGTEFRITPAA